MSPSWSATRLATGAALGVWAALFWVIIAADRLPDYLASRTEWLAPAGALTLTAAALGRLASARAPHPEPLSRRQVLNLSVLVVPALLILVMPPVTLGSFAVERRGPSVKGAYASVTGRDLSRGDLSLNDVFGLTYTGEFGRLSARAGTTSSFTGFVSRDTASADEFTLNRFMITCCPGDAVNVQLRVVGAPPGAFRADDWVRVTGRIYPLGKQLVVDATEVLGVDRPKHPYLNPSR